MCISRQTMVMNAWIEITLDDEVTKRNMTKLFVFAFLFQWI